MKDLIADESVKLLLPMTFMPDLAGLATAPLETGRPCLLVSFFSVPQRESLRGCSLLDLSLSTLSSLLLEL